MKEPSQSHFLSDRHNRRLNDRRKPGVTFSVDRVPSFEPVFDASHAIETEEETTEPVNQIDDQPEPSASYIAEANWTARLHEMRHGTEFVSRHPIPDFRPRLVQPSPSLPRKRPLEEYMEIDPPEQEPVHLPIASPSRLSSARQRSASISSLLSAKSAPPEIPSAILSRRSPSVIRQESASVVVVRSTTGSVKSLPDLTHTKTAIRLDERLLRRLSVASVSTASPSNSVAPSITISIPAPDSPIISSRPDSPMIASPSPTSSSKKVMLAEEEAKSVVSLDEKMSMQDNTMFQFDDDDGQMDLDNEMIVQDVPSEPIEETDSFQALVEQLRRQTQKSKVLFNNRANMAALHIHGLRHIAEEVVMTQGERVRDPFVRSLIADYFTTFKDELLKHQKHYSKYEKVAIYHSRARNVYNKQEKRMMELKRQERMLQTEIENEQRQLEKTKANTNVTIVFFFND
ncbi:hypothetical protein A0J61_04666 [Choanephora cucurbitarum]|uniref:Uncharacterized protein n=1 Tax=Choanephora cucurbitarum TaxID=101091 RepID=A0A1C7NFG4_9FUNG|nr:hypothetical protein A0J61_04666 [Choanephora cucurbitarum]